MKKMLPIIVCILALTAAGVAAAQGDTEAGETASLVEAAKEAARDTALEQAAAAGAVQAATDEAAVVEATDAPGLAAAFDASTLGYMIRYPGDWMYDTPTNYQVVFSGKEGTDAYYATISIQNVLSARDGGKYRDPSEVADGVIGQLNMGATDVTIYDDRPFVYTAKDGSKLKGVEMKVEYTREGRKFRQWIVIVPRSAGEAFHIWSYTSPEDRYNEYARTAQLMLDSWEIR